jgi:hypothetical protein
MGATVEVTIRGRVVDTAILSDGRGRTATVADGAGHYHKIDIDSAVTPVTVVANPHSVVTKGQVWVSDTDGEWFARASRKDLPLRMTPADMTDESGLRTMEVEEFFLAYPNAVLVFAPNRFANGGVVGFTEGQQRLDVLASDRELRGIGEFTNPGSERVEFDASEVR